MRIKKAFISTILACSITASIIFSNMGIYSNTIAYADDTSLQQEQEPINVAKRTAQEIKAYIQNHPATISDPVTYAETPSTENPYNIGSLSNETLHSSLNIFNHVRYIAGLSDVTLNDNYNKLAQASTIAIAADTETVLSHFPKQASDLPDDIYQLGAEGASHSNIAWGSSFNYTLNDSIVNGWMNDGDEYNIDRLGHRRWILNPSMSATGFGVAQKRNGQNRDNGTYLSMYAFDRNNRTANEHGVSWPAQTMPVEYFGEDFPWSISFGVTISNDTTVKLTDTKSGKVWNFSKNSADGDFYISNDGYGQIGCVIFRPTDKLSYKSGDSYLVEISNLGTSTLKNDVSYNVNFFSLNDNDKTCANDSSIPHTYGEWVTTKEPTTTENGIKQRICTVCGHIETQELYPETKEKYGDVNGDNEINSSDAVILKKYLAKMNVSCNEKLADVNHDKSIDSSDIVILLKYLAGYSITL